MNKLSILLVEDNHTIAKQIATFLEGLSWHVDYADCGKVAISLVSQHIYDVILLDLNLPDIDGLDVCRQIKAASNMPILMLTARDAFEDKARGFNYGADDYLTKPFDFRELALRCQALSRRHALHIQNEVQLGPLLLYTKELRATYSGKPLVLTPLAYKILFLIVQQHPQPVSRSVITHYLWGDEPPESDALKSHIYSLRKQLDGAAGKAVLTTIHQIGYQLSLDGDV